MRGIFLGILSLLVPAAYPATGAPRVSSKSKTLVICDDTQEPPTLNPYQAFSEKIYILIQQVLEGLVRFGPDGEFEPCLAERWRRINPTTMRFFLRKGVIFHNGESLDAKAVKFSLEKYVDPQTHYLGIGFVGTISAVNIIDDHTVDVITHAPDGLLLNRLAGFVLIVPPDYYRAVGDNGFATHPIGTGPFQFDHWEKGHSIVMRSNRKYWMPGFPKVDRLVFDFMPTDDQVNKLLSGEVDILTSLPGTRTLDVQRNEKTYVIKKPSFYTMVGNFNLSRRPFSDRRVRQALNLGFNREDLVRYDLLGNGITIGTISLPGEFGHNDSVRPYPYDPREAKRLLAEAGYPNGLTLKVLLKVNADRVGKVLASQLEAIGVHLKITRYTEAEIPQYFQNDKQMEWDMMISDCPDPMNNAYFIRSIYLEPMSPFSFHSQPILGEKLAQLVGELDPKKQKSISEEIDRYIHDESLVLPTYQRIVTYGAKRGVHFTPYLLGMPYFFATSVEDANAK